VSPAPSGDARTQMIDAAERLAVEQGLGAMSLRAVQAGSGQRNKSAAQYHFGSRQGLIEALVSTRMGPINERRLELLDALDDDASLRELVEVLVVPLAEHSLRPQGSTWSRFLVQGYADPELSHVVRSRVESRPYQEVRRRLAAALTHLPAELRDRRTDQATGLLVSGLAAAEAGHGSSLAPEALVSDLIDLCTAVLEAPASPRTLALLEGEARSA
jgi:AcrR family transcriptional regulator